MNNEIADNSVLSFCSDVNINCIYMALSEFGNRGNRIDREFTLITVWFIFCIELDFIVFFCFHFRLASDSMCLLDNLILILHHKTTSTSTMLTSIHKSMLSTIIIINIHRYFVLNFCSSQCWHL